MSNIYIGGGGGVCVCVSECKRGGEVLRALGNLGRLWV